ncbi:MAG: TonB family protein [Candidatus Obscuribacterales bacterium]|nr:TonB family protein [Candidatus Obscuribacterales bacterium]
MTSTSVRPSGYNQSSRDPNTAAVMSLLLPGLGQMYNGETRKGILFICVALLNLVLILAMLFNQPILDALLAFGTQFHMKPNKMLLIVLREAYLGSSVSFILMGFFLTFVFFAVRDAYDHAALKRRRIYPDFVIELPEATSGSYIFHFSLMVALFIVAFFFIIPPMPKSQLTEIEFVDPQMEVKKKVISKVHSSRNSEDRTNKKFNPNKPKAAASAPKAESKQQQQQKQPQKQQAPAQSAPKAPAPTPQPHPAPPTPKPAAQAPAPSPSPSPSPRPMPMPTRAPSPAAPSPMPRMASPSPTPTAMPRMAPSPMAMPTATPMPMAAAPKSFNASPMPSLAPSALPSRTGSGAPMPTPMARPSGGGGATGLPTLAPTPIAMGSGSGAGTPGFAPLARGGGSQGGGSWSGPTAPAPVAASGGGSGKGGGASSGGPVPVAMSGGGGSRGGTGSGASSGPAPVRAGRGGGGQGGNGWSSGPISISPSVPRGGSSGGGDGSQGNTDGPAGKPSVAAQADVDFGPYMADLQRRIKRAWFPPRGQESKRVVVIFKVHSQGELSDLRIDKSSGFAVADQAALQAVQNAAPFRPLPAGAPSVVDIQFTFDYNVFSGGRSF